VLGPDFLLNDEIMPTVASIRQMDVFVPLPFGADAVTNRRFDENFNVMVRLKPGVTMDQARSDVFAIAARIRDQDKRDRAFTLEVVPLVESVVGNVRLTILVLFGAVTLVVLIACANVANLLLTRAAGRQKEVAVRTALGASWVRLARQMLAESLVLGLLGGAAGLVVAYAALQVVRTLNPGNIPRLDAIGLDGTVLVFTIGLSLLTGLLFGLAPALRAARLDPQAALKAGGRQTHAEGGLGTSRLRLRGLLVVAEVAIALMLLVGAGLLVRSFTRLQEVSPGFDPDGVISFRLGSPGRFFKDRNDSLAYFRALSDALAAVPGVSVRGAVSSLPFTSSVGWGSMNVEGWTPAPGQELQVDQRGATVDYFRTMNIPLELGRYFTDADLLPNTEPVVIIDKAFAARFWPGGDALGRSVWFDPKNKLRIVGVVGAVKQYGLDIEGRIVVYFPNPGGSWQVARTAGDPEAVGAAMIRTVREFDPAMTIADVQTMRDRMSASMARPRFATAMFGAFAGFAMILAIVGVYGVMSRMVSQGAHDIGVRMALGAERRSILLLVLKRGLTLTAAGVIVGLAGAIALTRLMAAMLFGVSATDAATFVTGSAVLIATAILAVYVPARRATRVEPVVALRDE
jgi:predicted permease